MPDQRMPRATRHQGDPVLPRRLLGIRDLGMERLRRTILQADRDEAAAA
jgi:hypothetical protein